VRIAIDARCVADHFPGIGRYTYNLLAALAELAPPHTLCILHTTAMHNTRHDLRNLARFPGVELVAVGARPFSLAEQFELSFLLRRLRVDLYHAPYYVRPYFGLPCPSVVTLHDVIPLLFPQEVAPRARVLFDLLMRLAIRSSDAIITISESARRDISAAYGVDADRMFVTLEAADPRFHLQSPEEVAEVRRKYRLPERYILSLSSNKPHKNLPMLVEAFAHVCDKRRTTDGERQTANDGRRTMDDQQPTHHAPRTTHHAPRRLVIAGHWDARYPQARDLVTNLGLQEHVRFLHDVAEADLPGLYAGAELFVFPSLYEGFGLPLLEAMACGAPVLCCNTSSVPEVVGDAALPARPDVDSLAAALTRLLEDAALREALSAAGRQQARQFSWRKTAEATLAVYEHVGARSPRPPHR
jgi:alpha-1,3-rhamnosyl/mannosyltransferase